MSWRIAFIDGTEETTPEQVDRVTTTADGVFLLALATRAYGGDKVIKTYPVVNIKSWGPIQ
jgi:hypothetical protein